MSKTNVHRYELIDYFDVRGDVSYGWEVNNQCVLFRDLQISDSTTDMEIIEYLVTIGFISHFEKNKVKIEWSDEAHAEIYIKRTLKPIGRLCKAD